MNRSPLTLRRINKLIGQAMRAVQLSTGKRREAIKSALGYLNSARRTHKANLPISCELNLNLAAIELRYANALSA